MWKRIYKGFIVRKLGLSALLMVLCLSKGYAQERFYFRNGSTFSYRIVEANDKEIKYLEVKGSNPVKRVIDRENVIVAFNAKGMYFLIESIDSDPEKSRNQLENFYNASGPLTDILIKSTPVEVIPCSIRMESEAVNYLSEEGKSASINKKDLVAIIYKDGSHQLLKEPEEAKGLLKAAYDDYRKFTQQKRSRNIKVDKEPKMEEEKPKEVATYPVLSEEEYKSYRQKSIGKVEQFGDYLQVIADRRFSMNERELAVKNALQLFMPDTQIEVSSKNRKTVTKLPLEQYLKRLKMLPYGNVEIKWSKVEYIKELKQESDGNYYGTIIGSQTFTGYGNQGGVSYSDVTRKSVKVKLESYQKEMEGEVKSGWSILLGNIGVVSDE